MIYQLHWQNRDNPSDTEFVAQASDTDFPGPNELYAHLTEVIARRRNECPTFWRPMICDETCEHFVTVLDKDQSKRFREIMGEPS